MTSEADRIVDLYRRNALAWTTARGNRPMEGDWIERFCGLLPADPTVLDIGCGSGEPIARSLEQKGCAVTGIDSAPEMIALFKSNLPHQQARVADMRTLSLGRRFHGLIAWDSFFHLDHNSQRAMFPIFHEHAEPRAALLFTSGPAHGEAIGTMAGEPLYHASLAPEEYRELFQQNGFEVIAHQVNDSGCDRTVWLAQLR